MEKAIIQHIILKAVHKLQAVLQDTMEQLKELPEHFIKAEMPTLQQVHITDQAAVAAAGPATTSIWM